MARASAKRSGTAAACSPVSVGGDRSRTAPERGPAVPTRPRPGHSRRTASAGAGAVGARHRAGRGVDRLDAGREAPAAYATDA
ncbi:hypothetical protein RND61_17260, partial [Streptomyces sp. TRM76323]